MEVDTGASSNNNLNTDYLDFFTNSGPHSTCGTMGCYIYHSYNGEYLSSAIFGTVSKQGLVKHSYNYVY